MVISAPIEGAARKYPKPSGPTFKISSAKIGKRAITPPNSTETKSREIDHSTILLFQIKRKPSPRLCRTFSVSILGKSRFCNKLIRTKQMLTSTATVRRLVSRPKNASIKPPSIGPMITPLCQPIVVQVAPLA